MRYNQFFSLFGNEYEADKETQTEPGYDIIGLTHHQLDSVRKQMEQLVMIEKFRNYFEPEYDSVDDIIGLSYKDFEVKQSEQERYEKFLDTCLVMEGLFPQVKKRREHMLKLGLY